MKTGHSRSLILGVSLLFAALPVASTGLAQDKAPAAVDGTLLPYASTKDSVRLPDGRSLHLVCMGKGRPVVVLAAGGGGWSIDWSLVQPAVAAVTRVCSWDRAGLGLSAPSPEPQTVDNTTTDLEAALRADGVGGPYILVGHSLGAYNSLLFADREPRNVAGMVLVDPSVPDQPARFARITPAISRLLETEPPVVGFLQKCAAALRTGAVRRGGPDPDGCLRPPPPPPTYPPELRAALQAMSDVAPDVIASAMEDIAAHASAHVLDRDSRIVIKADRNYGAMPLIVLSAGDDGESPDLPAEIRAELPAQLAEKQRAHAELARLSTRGVHRIVAGSSHDIPHIRPQAVVDAIDEVVAEARGPSPARPAH